MIGALQIKRMSRTEQLQTMELLWDSLSTKVETLASPAWHGEILQERLAKVEAGHGEFLTIPQLKKRLARRGK
jgi:putative addiction module component (TIGR02574 family)